MVSARWQHLLVLFCARFAFVYGGDDEEKAGRACRLPRHPRATHIGKACPHGLASCLNNNWGYASLEEAWNACGQLDDCAYISIFRGVFYTRRKSDVDMAGGFSYIYDCSEAMSTSTKSSTEGRGSTTSTMTPTIGPSRTDEKREATHSENEFSHRSEEVTVSEEAEGIEERLPESDTSVAIAATLLAAISFEMSLFYLLAHHDQDIRMASYEVISSTISIFCATLIFGEVQEVWVSTVLRGDFHPVMVIGASILHMLLWFCLMQIVLAVITGSVPGMPKPDDLDKVHMRLKSWAILFAHITGFASLQACGAIQQEYFRSSPALSFAAVPVSYGILATMAATADRIRLFLSTLGGDTEIDDLEDMWDKGAEEAENDFFGLAISFTLIQSIRYAVSGILPNALGEEEDTAFDHGPAEVCTLYCCALLFLTIKWWCNTLFFYHHVENEWYRRQVEIFGTVCSMSFAWATFYGTRWALAAFGTKLFERDTTLLCVISAVSLSFGSFLAMMMLDRLADMDCTNDDVDMKLRDCIRVLGLLVGFAWEQTFDIAELALAERTTCPGFAKLVLASFSVIILIPAWRYHLLPMAIAEGYRYGFILENVEREHGSLEQLAAKIAEAKKATLKNREERDRIANDPSISLQVRRTLHREALAKELLHRDARWSMSSTHSPRYASKEFARLGSDGTMTAPAQRLPGHRKDDIRTPTITQKLRQHALASVEP